jgi:hypothetical protein
MHQHQLLRQLTLLALTTLLALSGCGGPPTNKPDEKKPLFGGNEK